MLLIAVSIQAQSVAEVARRERERQAKLKAVHVITSVEPAKAEEPKPAAPAVEQGAAPQPSAELPKPQAAPPVDPVQVWNDQLEKLRARIQTLQDQETDLVLQLSQANNQVYAPVTDPATQQRALALVGQIQQQLAATRKDLDEARKSLDSLNLQGPPKK